MSDVWKIGQEINAKDYYNTFKELPLTRGDVLAAKALTNVCEKMTQAYEQVIQDQNEYLIDIETSYEEMSTLEADLQAKIKQVEERLAELLKKQEDGTITESEQAEILSLNSELESLRAQADKQLGQKQDDISKLQENANKNHKSKKAIATNYGEVAIEKGEPLSETKDKTKSFWRKIFGGWDKSEERKAGKNLLQAGNDLLDKVSIATEIDETILKKTKPSI